MNKQHNTLLRKLSFVTLGPLPITVTDFWHLVWQEKVRIIAMVTNVKEGKTKKCEQYWPDEKESGHNYGPFSVTVVEQHIFADYTIRTVQLVVSNILFGMFVFEELYMTITLLRLQTGVIQFKTNLHWLYIYINVLSYTTYTH